MKQRTSNQTKYNWLMDAGLFLSALAASLSGIYFLFAPSGGFQGGRNPAYGLTFLFARRTWDDIHTWSSVLMIAVALLHIALHWKWIRNMSRRFLLELAGRSEPMNPRGRFNLLVNAAIGITFVLSAVSGVYFLFVGGSHGGLNPDPLILFPRTAWDSIHTWSSVLMIIAAIIHFAIHWRWVVNVIRRVLSFPSRPSMESSRA